jgi:hypothetical protein
VLLEFKRLCRVFLVASVLCLLTSTMIAISQGENGSSLGLMMLGDKKHLHLHIHTQARTVMEFETESQPAAFRQHILLNP